MKTTVEIADLIQPKFKPGEVVFLTDRDYNGQLLSVRRVVIEEVQFTVRFYKEQSSCLHKRSTDLVYDLLNNGQASESRLFATAEEAAGAAK